MTNEEINHVIAEFCGYKFITFNRGWIACGDGETQVNIPDYCNDLNAMHEAEKMLTAEQARSYDKELQKIGYRNRLAGAFWLWHFSAAWKAEAFLKTIGKWKK